MLANARKIRPDVALLAAGFFTSSWDLLLARKVGGFTLKAYQPLFLAAFLCNAWPLVRAGRWHELTAPLRRPFPLAMLTLVFFYLGTAPWSSFPVKSFLYSCWLLFDVAALWLVLARVGAEAPARLARIALAPVLFDSLVILVDEAAYFFGYRGGVIGHNQDASTNLMVSRPHAFTFEPSYAAAYLVLGALTLGPWLLREARPRWLSTATLAAALLAILSTTSRSGWAALGLGVTILLALIVAAGRRMPWKAVLAGAVAIPVLCAAFFLAMPQAQRRNLGEIFLGPILHGTDSSGLSRFKAFGMAYDFARDTHGLGTGLGASYHYYKDHGGFDLDFQGPFTDRMNGNEVIMSTWGQLVGEGGVVAPLLYALAGFFLARALWRAWHASGSPLAHGSLAACLVFFGFTALWLGNVCRGDVWVWFGVWGAMAAGAKPLRS